MYRKLAALAVIALVALAGCTGSGGTGGDGDPASPADPSMSAEQIVSNATAAMEDVETYRIAMEQNLTITGELSREMSVTGTGAFDRANRELRIRQTSNMMGRSVQSLTYLVNETIYVKSAQHQQQYASKWIKFGAASRDQNFSEIWKSQDTLTRQKELLNVSSVELDGVETVNGTEAYALELDVNESQFASMAGGMSGGSAPTSFNSSMANISDASFTYWIGTESYLPVRSDGHINMSLSMGNQSLVYDIQIEIDFYAYDDPVSIELPDGASTAVEPFNLSESSGASVATAD